MQSHVLRVARRTGVLLVPFLAASFAVAQTETAPAAGPAATPTTPAATAAPAPAAAAAPDEAGSYSLGLTLGEQLRNAGVGGVVSLDSLTRGMQDALGGKALAPADKERGKQFLQAGREIVAGRNRTDAREFLTHNAAQDGVKTTASGLQYKIVTAGDPKAASPGNDDQVTVQYRGSLLDGTEFDSSYTRGQPATFRLNAVIKGWREALALMKPGAKWRLYVPPELAYDTFSPPPIPPGSLLIFDVELLTIGPPGAARAKSPAGTGAKNAAGGKGATPPKSTGKPPAQ